MYSMFVENLSRSPIKLERSTDKFTCGIPTRKYFLPRKEVIHPQLPLRMPCYDFTLIANPTLTPSKLEISGIIDSLGVTGGEYKTRERIHRNVADLRLLAIPTS